MSNPQDSGSVKPRLRLIADGTQSEYYFHFPVFSPDDVKVYLGNNLLKNGYSVTLNQSSENSSGTVIFDTPPEAGTIITLYRSIPLKRTTHFKEAGPFMSSKVNLEFDYQLACMEQLEDLIGRTVTFPPSAPTQMDVSLPMPEAGKAIVWNDDETELKNSSFQLNDLEKNISDVLQASETNSQILQQVQTHLQEIRNTKEELATIRPELEQQIAAKADNNAANLTTEAKTTIIELGIPDYNRGHSITSPFTAAEPGLVNLQGGSASTTINVTVNGVRIVTDDLYALSVTRTRDIWVATGDVISWSGMSTYNPLYTFFPLKGTQDEETEQDNQPTN